MNKKRMRNLTKEIKMIRKMMKKEILKNHRRIKEGNNKRKKNSRKRKSKMRKRMKKRKKRRRKSLRKSIYHLMMRPTFRCQFAGEEAVARGSCNRNSPSRSTISNKQRTLENHQRVHLIQAPRNMLHPRKNRKT